MARGSGVVLGSSGQVPTSYLFIKHRHHLSRHSPFWFPFLSQFRLLLLFRPFFSLSGIPRWVILMSRRPYRPPSACELLAKLQKLRSKAAEGQKFDMCFFAEILKTEARKRQLLHVRETGKKTDGSKEMRRNGEGEGKEGREGRERKQKKRREQERARRKRLA